MRPVFAQSALPAPEVPNSALGNGITIAIVAGLLLLMVLVARRLMSRGRTLEPKALPPPPVSLETPKVALPQSEGELKARTEAEHATFEAERLHGERVRLQREAKQADSSRKAQLEADAKRLKEQEEEAKKDAYRAKKSAEVEEKERKKREREEGERLVALAAEKERLEAAHRAKEAAEDQARKVEAESGQTLLAGLSKTKREGFMVRLNGLFAGAPKAIDEKILGELEDVLFSADIGVKTASALVEFAREKARSKELDSSDKIKAVIRKEVERIVDLKANHTLGGGGPPHVIMVVGVNGAGKTTTIGKLAAKAKGMGKSVVLGAGDTFRAAAAEQLDVWAGRAGAHLVKGKEDADPASVVFEAAKVAKERNADVMIADTAGRLHTKTNLMEELKKTKRVLDKAVPGAPHEVLLVLDATNGQNAIAQARQFHDAVGITAIALTKLDGTAKGGVIIGICDELKVPVAWVGVGEKVADLRPFDPKEFVAALFDD
jgi:fused signal recognition particle receptor